MKNILYIGQFKDACGYANAARGYLKLLFDKLDKSEYKLHTLSLNIEKEDYSSNEIKNILSITEVQNIKEFINNNSYILLAHVTPNVCEINFENLPIKDCLNNKNCLKRINMVAWETTTIPRGWLEHYKSKNYDELIVFCQWNKEVFESQTGLKATVVPHVINDFSLERKKRNDKFRIFSMSQWGHRKGFDILLKAYYQEFFDQDDVELFIKTYKTSTLRGSSEEIDKQIITAEIKHLKESSSHYKELATCKVLLKLGFASKEEVASFYSSSDVFCSPTRGEAFGMCIAQAALSGLPVIVPNKGGHLDYLDKENNYFINSEYEPAYNMFSDIYSSKDMNLVESSVSSTRKQLRMAYNDWRNDKLEAKAIKVKKFAKDFLDEQFIFNKFMSVL